jgi:gluconate 5-dehydrogenase
VEKLKKYSDKNGIDSKQWNLLTGDKETIYELGVYGYLLSAKEDALAPGGAGAEHLAMHLSANLASLIDLCRALVPPMQARGWGRVVAIGSILATRPRAETFAYAAIKAAQATTIRALARDVAGQGVTMNIVSPGAIETERLAERYADPAFQRAVVARVPAGRQGRPGDCVGPVLFLCSDEAAYVTGADLPVDGGWSIGDPPGVLPGTAA